jgi:hypothetical protein
MDNADVKDRLSSVRAVSNGAVAIEKLQEQPKKTVGRHYYKQYAVKGDRFFPIGLTKTNLPAGFYKCKQGDTGIYAELMEYSYNEIIRFKGSATEFIKKEFETFWQKRKEYEERGEPHKRGYLLWGPPGGGKTCLVTLLIQDFIAENDGVVFIFSDELTSFLEQFRDIEPDRKIMIIIEDIDAYFEYEEEHDILYLLDGEVPLVNTVVIATTNYPEKLPDRVKNRPSRFDRLTFVDNPTQKDREFYLSKKSKKLTKTEIKKWAKETEGFSFAHLKELLLAVEVFGAAYDETLNRLNTMRKATISSMNYERKMRGQQSAFGFSAESVEPPGEPG